MGKPKHDSRKSGCGVAYALDVLGDKWTLVIIKDMVLSGKRHYTKFMTSPEKMASNILADRLKRLEEEGIVSKTQDPDHESKFIYQLTAKGKELIPLVLETMLWGSKHAPNPTAPPALLRWARKDREGLTRAILECLKKNEAFLQVHGFIPASA